MSVIHNLDRRSLAGFLLVLSIASLIFVSLPARASAAPTGANFDHVVTLNVADSTGKTFTTSQPPTVLPASTGGSVPALIGWGGVGIGESMSDIQTEMMTLNQLGYNIVRVAFEPTCTTPSDGGILGSYDAAKLGQVIGLAKQYGLWIIVDYHGYNELETSSTEQCWLGFWQSLVKNFTSSYSQIIWEGLNEPHMTSNTDVAGLSSAYQALINEVRALGDTHWIVVQSMCSASCGFSDANMAAGYPMVTDPLGNLSQGGRIFISLHSYMGYQWYSSSWNNATAETLAQEFHNAVVTGMKTTGWPALNTEGGTSTGSQVPPDEVLSGSSGYSVVSFHFAQTLTNLYDANAPQRINWVWWTAGSWTNTPGAGTLGSLQCNSNPIGWGCLLAFAPLAPPTADFTISATSPGPVNTGQSAIATITIASLYGFTGTVPLSDKVPPGLACSSISPGTLLGSGTATLSCSASVEGTYTLTITGTSGSLTHSAIATFAVNQADFTLEASTLATVNAGQSGTTTITVTALNGFDGAIALTDTVPNGLSCGNISSTSLAGSGTATVSCSATKAGSYTLTITGTSGSLVHSKTATFNFQGYASQPSGGGLCLSCFLPKVVTTGVWLLMIGALIGLASSIALLHLRASVQLAAARRRARSLNTRR